MCFVIERSESTCRRSAAGSAPSVASVGGCSAIAGPAKKKLHESGDVEGSEVVTAFLGALAPASQVQMRRFVTRRCAIGVSGVERERERAGWV